MYYKNGSIGIRRKEVEEGKSSGKQIWCIGAGTGLSERRLRIWGARVLKKLDEGSSEDDAYAWITHEMQSAV